MSEQPAEPTAPTNQHYSQEVGLFTGFLDPYMKYSSGWFHTGDESLDVSIVDMLDKIIEMSAVKPGDRVLEIGNGWGSLIKRLRETVPDVDYLGVNPSSVQLEYIAREVDPEARCIEAPFEEVMNEIEGPFDAVYMIGALCHMRDKLAVMQKVSRLLRPGGRVIIEDTFFLSEGLYQAHNARRETKFVQDEIFGYAHVYSLARHFDELRQARLRMVVGENNSDHYARTIEIWTERLKSFDSDRFPLAPAFVAYMDVFQRGWSHTISNYLMACEPLPDRRSKKVALPFEG